MGFTRYDIAYWKVILLIMGFVGVIVIFLFFPLVRMPLCVDTGCTESNILKSLYEIFLEQKSQGFP